MRERIRGVMVGRFVVHVFRVYVAWCCSQVFLFLLPGILMDFR